MRTFFTLVIAGIFIISCAESRPNDPVVIPVEPTHVDTKKTLREIEEASPLEYLAIDGSYHTNLIGQWVIEGTVRSTASVAIYKDVVIDIVYYSKTGSEIGRIQRTMFEFFEPGKSFAFKYKTDGFGGTASVKVGLSGAGVKTD